MWNSVTHPVLLVIFRHWINKKSGYPLVRYVLLYILGKQRFIFLIVLYSPIHSYSESMTENITTILILHTMITFCEFWLYISPEFLNFNPYFARLFKILFFRI